MAVTAALVKELREKTQAGMMACKKALVETNGDIEKAIDLMRTNGEIKAQQKSDRVAAEGSIIIKTSDDKKSAIILEINCETDFVGKDENFLSFANEAAELALQNKIADVAAFSEATMANGETVDKNRLALVSKIGENIQVRRLQLIQTESGVLGHYIHGGRIGVIVEINNSEKETLAKDIAMHIAASKPIVVNPEDVPQELVEKEREIYSAQAKESGKPDDIVEKMVQGRIGKYINEVALVGQPFVKDPNQKISQLLKAESSNVICFERFEVGEGIEKKVDNFAEEVMSQIQS